jgi:UDP-GlcNAc:undecaprenyl-phosphate/decaprenyl-phosphate GlcNAc-1-phosphate transferase
MPRRTGIGPFAGPLLVLGAYDLRERAMLGDTGSTLLGALAGQHLVLTLDGRRLTAAASSLAAITLFAELTSLSAVIDRVPPLRALDWLGRRNSNA